MFHPYQHRPGKRATLALAAVVVLGIAACSGSGGQPGPDGAPGPAGAPAAGPAAGDVAGATEIVPLITSVTIASRSTVNFRLADENGLLRRGLAPGQIRFTIAQLTPGTGGRSSEWRSYVNRTENPVAGFPGATPTTQATYETATAGAFTDRGDGTYAYQFAVDVSSVPGMTYDPALTHRVALQISELPADGNAAYTWQPSTGATNGIFSREIVNDTACNACHERLMFHGGGRRDVQYCVTCHNPGSTDAQSTNTVDFTVMIHKIHRGAGLPSVVAGGEYYIVGFGDDKVDFSDIEWTQDIRNCQTCHDENDARIPQARNWRLVQNSTACGSCHDDLDFATGANHPAGAATDDTCEICHGPNATLYGGTLKVTEAHRQPLREAGAGFKFNVLAVTNTAPGLFPSVRFSVTDPTNNNVAYNIQTAAPFVQCAGGASRLAIDIGWSTTDYTNVGTGRSPAQPIQLNPLTGCGGTSTNNNDGTFTVTSGIAVPATQTGTLIAALEGHPALDVDADGTIDRIAVTSDFRYAAISGTLAPRREVVEIGKCLACHNQLTLHGNNRTDKIEVCVACHNPGATDVGQRAGACATALGADDVSIDFKSMIHRIHASGLTGVPYGVCGFGNTPITFDILYPGALNNCEGCHKADTYYPVDPTEVIGPTTDAVNPALYTDDVAMTPNASVCGGCHAGAASHMQENGANYLAGKNAAGNMVSATVETCSLCHGPGEETDVKVAHRVASFGAE